jgi:hypothetical protein
MIKSPTVLKTKSHPEQCDRVEQALGNFLEGPGIFFKKKPQTI